MHFLIYLYKKILGKCKKILGKCKKILGKCKKILAKCKKIKKTFTDGFVICLLYNNHSFY